MSGAFELIVFPDVEANLVTMLTGQPALSGFSGLVISASYKGYTDGASWVHIHRSGGLPSNHLPPDVASLYFDVLAADRQTCNHIARIVQALMFSNIGTIIGVPGSGMKIQNVINIAGLAWFPDEGDLPRYTFAVQVKAWPI